MLINSRIFLFLSSPRRFGKSLLTATLRELYLGNRALFQELWIEDKIDWQSRPVILLNFNALDYILEFKMTTAQVALDQIKARSYDQPYRNQGKTIILLGITFDKEQRAIGNWKSELA